MRDVIGQGRLLTRLAERAIGGGLAHAYVLSGPRSIGKRIVATRLAQTLICVKDVPGGCGVCTACRKIEQGTHPDVLVVTRLTDREKDNDAKVITIGQVREMQRDLALRPLEGRRRIVIVDDAADLSEDAEVALLKTLEEPPVHALLLLVTPTPAFLKPTILSRVQTLALRLVPVAEIAAGLEARKLKDAAKHAAASGGRPGVAIRLATDETERTARKALDAEFFRLVCGGLTDRFAWAADLADEKDTQKRARAIDLRLGHWAELLRDAALAATGHTDRPLRGDRSAESAALGRAVHTRALVDTALLLGRFHEDLLANANARAMLELFALRLPHLRTRGPDGREVETDEAKLLRRAGAAA